MIASHNIHRLALGPYARGAPEQLPSVKTALHIPIHFLSVNVILLLSNCLFSLHESRAEFVELIESRSIQENLNEAVDKFRTALGHCVLPVASK